MEVEGEVCVSFPQRKLQGTVIGPQAITNTQSLQKNETWLHLLFEI